MTGVPTPLVGYRRLLMIGPRSHQRARARPRRILIVEDELVIALMIEEIVREMGCAVSGIAGTLGMARLQFAKRDFDAALLDVNLGGEYNPETADDPPRREQLEGAGSLLLARTGVRVKTLRYRAHRLEAHAVARPRSPPEPGVLHRQGPHPLDQPPVLGVEAPGLGPQLCHRGVRAQRVELGCSLAFLVSRWGPLPEKEIEVVFSHACFSILTNRAERLAVSWPLR